MIFERDTGRAVHAHRNWADPAHKGQVETTDFNNDLRGADFYLLAS